jgi:hypothetical protein
VGLERFSLGRGMNSSGSVQRLPSTLVNVRICCVDKKLMVSHEKLGFMEMVSLVAG